MLNYIIRFIKFLMPIVGKAGLQVAADTLTEAAYPRTPRRRGYDPRLSVPYASYTPYNRMRDYAEKDIENTMSLFDPSSAKFDTEFATRPSASVGFHDVLMVAFDLRGRSAKDVHEWLHSQMPTGDMTFASLEHGEIHLDSWWVANDQRFDGSDCDSAVFVSMGNQASAREVLRRELLVD